MVKEENTLINIAICDDLVLRQNRSNAFAYIKKADDKNEYRSFSDGSELWDDIASWKIRMEPVNSMESSIILRNN